MWGDPDAGVAASDVMVEGDFVYPSVAHACMEPNVTLARWDPGREVMELWTSTHAPYFIAKEVSHLLGLEHDQVVCREVATGGSFGSKSKASEHEILAAALARKTGMPVLISLAREEEFASNKPRHRFETRLRTYADADGNLRAFETEVNVDNGAYSHMGSSVMRVGVITLGSVYRADGVRFDARLVDTATQPGGQYRGYGTPQVTLAMESQLDEIAERLGMDPIDLRIRNAVEPHTETLCGYRVTTARLADCLETVRRELDWDAKRAARTPGRGVGVSTAAHGSGAYAYPLSNVSEAGVDVGGDGRVRVRFGGSDAGTGQKTILAQMAAEELGVAPEDVDVLSMDGELTPLDLGAWSSRATHMSGMATGRAAREMAVRLRELAAGKLGCAARDVELRDGAAHHGDDSVGFADLAGAEGGLSLEARYELEGTETITPGEDKANLSPTYSFAAHGAEVEVDVRTGKVTVLDYVAAHDIGRAINPVMAEGQIIGGAVHGLGAALGEELIRTEGRVVNPAYIDYAVPRAADVPAVRAVIVEGHDDAGPYGAKSVGEIPIIPPGAAIANAVYDAVGVRVRDLPITPDKVLRALAEKEGRVRDHRLRRRPSRWWIALMRAAYPRGVHALLHRWGTRFGRAGPVPGAAAARLRPRRGRPAGDRRAGAGRPAGRDGDRRRHRRAAPAPAAADRAEAARLHGPAPRPARHRRGTGRDGRHRRGRHAGRAVRAVRRVRPGPGRGRRLDRLAAGQERGDGRGEPAAGEALPVLPQRLPPATSATARPARATRSSATTASTTRPSTGTAARRSRRPTWPRCSSHWTRPPTCPTGAGSRSRTCTPGPGRRCWSRPTWSCPSGSPNRAGPACSRSSRSGRATSRWCRSPRRAGRANAGRTPGSCSARSPPRRGAPRAPNARSTGGRSTPPRSATPWTPSSPGTGTRCPATRGSSTPPQDWPNAPPNGSPGPGPARPKPPRRRNPHDGAGRGAPRPAAGRREAHRPRTARRDHHRDDRHPQPHRRGGRAGPLGRVDARRVRRRRLLPADRRRPGQRRRPAARRRHRPRPAPLRPDRHAHHRGPRRGPAPRGHGAAL
ncbi:molybdopterin-dependent oxidoreductase [Actinomadura madurae]|nr:molybdopterin cofactor-binding domain-containing protein [Actinomadura madurae]MCQ0020961.1 molybdopterin-dependent oxidoreductase [Actinomadura madurae]